MKKILFLIILLALTPAIYADTYSDDDVTAASPGWFKTIPLEGIKTNYSGRIEVELSDISPGLYLTIGLSDVESRDYVAFESSATYLSYDTSSETKNWDIDIWTESGSGTFDIKITYPYDTDGPPVPTITDEPGFSPGTFNKIEWSGVTDSESGTKDYLCEISDNPNFTNAENSGWRTDTYYTFTSFGGYSLQDGVTYYFRVKARDNVGNESNWSGVEKSVQDTNKPVIQKWSPPDQTQTEENYITVSVTATDTVGIKEIKISREGWEKIIYSASSYWIKKVGKSYNIPLRQGINTIKIKIKDWAGQTTEETFYIIYGIYTTEHFKFHFYAFTAQPATDPDNLYPHRVDETGWDVSTIEKPEGIPNYVYNFGKYFEEVSENSVKKEVKLYEKNNFNSN